MQNELLSTNQQYWIFQRNRDAWTPTRYYIYASILLSNHLDLEYYVLLPAIFRRAGGKGYGKANVTAYHNSLPLSWPMKSAHMRHA
jgi:hypothetical protein